MPTSLSQNLSDKELLKRSANGDKTAFSEIYLKYKNSLYSRAVFLLEGDYDTAKDLVQEAFISLWAKKENLSKIIYIKTYLAKVIYHICSTHLKNKSILYKKNTQYFLTTQIDVDFIPLERTDKLLVLYNLIQEQLTPHVKDIFIKIYFQKKSQILIAKELGIQAQTVRNIVHETMKKLRINFKEKLYNL